MNKMVNKLIVIILMSLITSCGSGQNTGANDRKSYPEECSKFYWFDSKLIDLELMENVVVDGIPATDFKTCSKYAHRFVESFGDSVNIQDRIFSIKNNKEEKLYLLQIAENKKLVKNIRIPIQDPVPEVHEYRMNILEYKNHVILLMTDMYNTYYRIVKYDTNGNELLRKDIEHTYVTHPEPNTDYHHRYLYYFGITNSQMIFTSHMAFADKFKTILLNMDDFSIKEYDKMTHGIILDENDQELVGFVTANEDYQNGVTNYQITMTDGSEHHFTLGYGKSACNFLLKDNLLYIANYHPIATGSALHCYDMKSRKIIWDADVLQINANHSEYWNKVTLSIYKNKLLMEGNEAYGNYLQIFDYKSGKRLAQFGPFIN